MLTFAELRQRSYALAAHWKAEYGLRKGDIVLCFMRNNNHYPVAFLASALLGCSLTGICPDLKEGKHIGMICHSESGLLGHGQRSVRKALPVPFQDAPFRCPFRSERERRTERTVRGNDLRTQR